MRGLTLLAYFSLQTAVSDGLPKTWDNTHTENINCLASSGNVIFAGTYRGVYRSTNSGAHWTSVSAGRYPAGSDSEVVCLTTSGTNIFAGTIFSGVFLSTNNGASWKQVSEGLPLDDYGGTGVYSLAANDSYLFAGVGFFMMEAGVDGRGLWRRPLSEMITPVGGRRPELPAHFSLGQNYPNPFNPTTVISYQLPAVSVVTLRVYDALGREVVTLVNEKQSPATYTIQFDGSKLASGVYFYQLQAGSFTQTRKMLLVK